MQICCNPDASAVCCMVAVLGRHDCRVGTVRGCRQQNQVLAMLAARWSVQLSHKLVQLESLRHGFAMCTAADILREQA